MAVRQRIVELNDRRQHGRRSRTVYVSEFIRSTFSPLDVLSDEALIRKYRLNREVIQELCTLVQPHLVRATRRNFALSPTMQLLAALPFYGSGSFFEMLGDGKRFFTSGKTARRGKALLTEELEKMEQALLRASADEAGTTEAEPAEKVACMEAGPSTGGPPSTMKSSFSRMYDRILKENDEPAGGHSTPSTSDAASSLTDTISLSSSDSDLRDQGVSTGRSSSSIDSSSAVKGSLSEAAKEMIKNALLRKPGGEDILEEYRSEKSLKHRTRRQLVNILASDMTERHGRIPTRQQREKYALGIITLFPALKDPFSPKGYVNQDFLLLFGVETSSKLLNKWDTTFKLKIIKEATQLTQSTDVCCLLKAAEKLPENDGNGKLAYSSCSSIDDHLQEREGKQPFILAVGRARNKIDTYYIAVDKQLIPCHATSSLGASDKLFKSHYVFNLSYDESLVHFYTFVQTTVFNIDVTHTRRSQGAGSSRGCKGTSRVCRKRSKAKSRESYYRGRAGKS
ncbi:hypothetical protein ACEWY4_016868 [Coilia grayii]|uniref:Uncharacterized protein n=1 Tax=Coilia grayii TaxID=363190 RepID=A0ABD1JLL9_9TELE